MPIIFDAGFFFFNARCTCAIVFTSLLKLLNRPHWTIGFFSSACVMKVDVGMFSSSAAKTRLTCSGHWLSGCFNQAGPVSHSLLMSSSTLMALVPISAGLSIPLTCFHYEKSVLYPVSQPLDWPQTLVVCGESYVSIRPETVTVYLHLVFFESQFEAQFVLSISLPSPLLAIPSVVLKDISSARFYIFQLQMLSRMNIPWLRTQIGHCTHRVLRCVSKHMKFNFVLQCIEVSSVNAGFGYNRKLFLPFQEFCFFAGLDFVEPMLPILRPDVLQQSSHANTEWSKNSDWGKYFRYQRQDLPLGYRSLDFFVGTSADLNTIVSNIPLQSKYRWSLCIWFNINLLRIADWF